MEKFKDFISMVTLFALFIIVIGVPVLLVYSVSNNRINSSSGNIIKNDVSWQYNISKIEFNSHYYLCFSRSNRETILHDPDCPKCAKNK